VWVYFVNSGASNNIYCKHINYLIKAYIGTVLWSIFRNERS